MPDTAYDAPVFHDGIWYPTPNTTVRGRLVSVTGVAYEFAPDRAIPHLRLMVPPSGFVAAPDTEGLYHKLADDRVTDVKAGLVIEVHCFPERLLKEINAARPREGEDVEITTGAQLVRGFLTYVVSAGGRWSTAEHWAPEDISTYCAFGAHHLHTGGEATQVFRPVTAPCKHTGGVHLPGCSLGRELAGIQEALESPDLIKAGRPPLLPGGTKLFTPGAGE